MRYRHAVLSTWVLLCSSVTRPAFAQHTADVGRSCAAAGKDVCSARAAIEKDWLVMIELMKRGADPVRLSSHYTEDIVIVEPDDSTIHGRASVESVWRKYFAEFSYLDVRRDVTRFDAQDNLAYEAGVATYAVREKSTGNTRDLAVRYIYVWKRDASGRWRLRDMNEAAPAPRS